MGFFLFKHVHQLLRFVFNGVFCLKLRGMTVSSSRSPRRELTKGPSPMQQINVKRYADPTSTGWAGWIEPEDKSWVAFIDLGGQPTFFLNRDPETGAILPDDTKGER
jgi:hypothetical protein